jgi:hypothetical protein
VPRTDREAFRTMDNVITPAEDIASVVVSEDWSGKCKNAVRSANQPNLRYTPGLYPGSQLTWTIFHCLQSCLSRIVGQ